MKTIAHPCQVCGRPAYAQLDDDASEEAVSKFLGLLTHDHCMPRKRKQTSEPAQSWGEKSQPELEMP